MDGVGRINSGEASSEAVPSGGRARKRDSLLLSARVRVGDQTATYEARVRNLSEGGLMIELDQIVEPGTPVTLDMRGLGEITGTVAWCTRGRLGVALDHPIDPARARKPIGAGGASGTVRPLAVPSRRSGDRL